MSSTILERAVSTGDATATYLQAVFEIAEAARLDLIPEPAVLVAAGRTREQAEADIRTARQRIEAAEVLAEPERPSDEAARLTAEVERLKNELAASIKAHEAAVKLAVAEIQAKGAEAGRLRLAVRERRMIARRTLLDTADPEVDRRAEDINRGHVGIEDEIRRLRATMPKGPDAEIEKAEAVVAEATMKLSNPAMDPAHRPGWQTRKASGERRIAEVRRTVEEIERLIGQANAVKDRTRAVLGGKLDPRNLRLAD